MAVYDNSRYITTPPTVRLGEIAEMLSIRTRFTFDLSKAISYTWRDGDTLDGVAYQFYEMTDLRWVILDANPQYRTEFDISAGDVIYIPDYDEVVTLVDGEE